MSALVKSSAQLDWHSDSAKEIWESELESLPNVQRLTEEDGTYLHDLLKNRDDVDSYLNSVNYYLFSGRNGLWIFKDRDDYVLLCWHPNIPGKIVIFTQITERTTQLISNLVRAVSLPPNGLMIARIKQTEFDVEADQFVKQQAATFHKCQEDILDWVYPVHILSTNKVTQLLGQEYMYVRNRLRQLHKHSVKILPFDAIHHSRAIENLLHRWVSVRAEDKTEYENLYAPYETLFSMSMNPLYGLKGLLVFIDDQLEGIGLWDVSGNQRKSGNMFVNLCNTAIKGLSEFLIVKCCEKLRQENVEYLNVGGSETEGLDNFKSKFRPVISLNLSTVKVEANNYLMKKMKLPISTTKTHAQIKR